MIDWNLGGTCLGIPKETADNEKRVALTPEAVNKLIDLGFEVLIENKAGLDSSFSNKAYELAGAKIVTQFEVWDNADIIVSDYSKSWIYKF